MSSLANWTYVNTVTIWPTLTDEWGQPVFDTPYTLQMDYMVGGDAATDENGTQFAPQSTYYFEALIDSPLVPKIHDYILPGDHTAQADPTTLNAERIKGVDGWPMGAFGDDELPDWRLVT